MAGSDRSGITTILDKARGLALDMEAVTSIGRYVRVAASTSKPMKSGQGVVELFDATVTKVELRDVSRQLFCDGHYARAVEDAFKLVNNAVKKRSGSDKDGRDLMLHVFKTDPPGPVLRINDLRTASQRDEQEGYRYVFAGVMSAIRNPRAHEHLLRDEPEAALEMLVIANHLLAVLSRAKRTRRRPHP